MFVNTKLMEYFAAKCVQPKSVLFRINDMCIQNWKRQNLSAVWSVVGHLLHIQL